jgi:hypothetical protein
MFVRLELDSAFGVVLGSVNTAWLLSANVVMYSAIETRHKLVGC